MKNYQTLFQSEDGNEAQRQQFLHHLQRILTTLDQKKNSEKTVLGESVQKSSAFYKKLVESSTVNEEGISMKEVVSELMQLLEGHPYQSHNYVTNVIPLSSIPGLLGMFTNMLVNSNSIWDVYGPAATECEVKVISMMSKIVGYDEKRSFGYTTWGGQGAVFNGLRIAIAKQYPNAKEEGVPNNLYCFASENAHYSLLKSIEAVGIGSNHLVRVKANANHEMDLKDLETQMRYVIQNGGVPVYVVATTGTTDSFAIDDVAKIKNITTKLEKEFVLKPIHIHADSALGGFYTFFNDYDFIKNPLQFEEPVKQALVKIQSRMRYIHLADSVCFDFHKLGQTPYTSSLFLVKDGSSLGLLDLEDFDTPYMGNRGYGSYHTSYTLECSRMGSSVAMYAALRAFGKENYQAMLANYVRVNLYFREQLAFQLPEVKVVNPNNVGPITDIRYYPNGSWEEEVNGRSTEAHIEQINAINKAWFEQLGAQRERVFFGDTTRICTVLAKDTKRFIPIAAAKMCTISPYTEVEHVQNFIDALKQTIEQLKDSEAIVF
ncbi:pyridoxal phosphate-dependent decarboxylase family protein [Kurthia massiliensis]|uniref:pyridoxal phosphate-dependent decarboxylase family protein n=1 Tax=Kurthia massiliensis TaxID=1033739 RepID=UPI00028907D7|nr:pyridoxal-dependent decarboxylase [Kurthia massiliensis]